MMSTAQFLRLVLGRDLPRRWAGRSADSHRTRPNPTATAMDPVRTSINQLNPPPVRRTGWPPVSGCRLATATAATNTTVAMPAAPARVARDARYCRDRRRDAPKFDQRLGRWLGGALTAR